VQHCTASPGAVAQGEAGEGRGLVVNFACIRLVPGNATLLNEDLLGGEV
jgi:hypothetical protein